MRIHYAHFKSCPAPPRSPSFLQVSIGSYPNTEPEATQRYKVKLQLNGRDAGAVEAAAAAIEGSLGPVFKSIPETAAR